MSTDEDHGNGTTEPTNGTNVRDEKGRYVKGNPGGPGRPSVKIERQYMEALTSVVSLEDWRAIVRAAVSEAKDGDDKARAWLAKYCLGKNPPSLTELKAKESAGLTAEEELRRAAEARRVVDSHLAAYARNLQG